MVALEDEWAGGGFGAAAVAAGGAGDFDVFLDEGLVQ